MAGLPQVSCVIECYNAQETLGAAVESALRQGGCSVEVIVVDDRSSDESWTVAQALAAADPRVRAYRNEKNCGPAETRNAAIRAARGDWIGILDADDEFREGRLETLIDRAAAVSADIVFDNQLVISAGQPATRDRVAFEDFPEGEITLLTFLQLSGFARKGLSIGYAKPLWRAAASKADERYYDSRWTIGEDWRFLYDAVRTRSRCAFLDVPLYLYQRPMTSLTLGRRNNWWTVWNVYRTALRESRQALAPSEKGLLRATVREALRLAMRKEVVIVLSFVKRRMLAAVTRPAQ